MHFPLQTLILSISIFSISICFPNNELLPGERNNLNAGPEQNFRSFLNLAIQNYSNWLQENNENPFPRFPDSPEYESTYSNMMFNMSYKFTDEQIIANDNADIEYYLQKSEVTLFEIGILEVGVSPAPTNDSSDVQIIIEGNYILNGTIFDGRTFNGEGKLRCSAGMYNVREYAQYWMVYTPEGFVDIISDVSNLLYTYVTRWTDCNFEGLGDDGIGGFANIVQDFVYEQYRKRAYFWQETPTLHRYLKEVFEKTPLVDILGIGANLTSQLK